MPNRQDNWTVSSVQWTLKPQRYCLASATRSRHSAQSSISALAFQPQYPRPGFSAAVCTICRHFWIGLRLQLAGKHHIMMNRLLKSLPDQKALVTACSALKAALFGEGLLEITSTNKIWSLIIAKLATIKQSGKLPSMAWIDQINCTQTLQHTSVVAMATTLQPQLASNWQPCQP